MELESLLNKLDFIYIVVTYTRRIVLMYRKNWLGARALDEISNSISWETRWNTKEIYSMHVLVLIEQSPLRIQFKMNHVVFIEFPSLKIKSTWKFKN